MGRKKKTNGVYFTEETQDAVIKYPTLDNQREKDLLYANHIHIPLCKIAEVWYHKIDMPYVDGEPLDIQMDCVIFMSQQLAKFKNDKGKAFSYFSIIARNYYILQNEKAYKHKKRMQTESIDEEFEIIDDSYLLDERNEFYQRLYPEFIQWLKDNFDKLFRVAKQKHLGLALIDMLENDIDSIEDLTQRNVREFFYKKIDAPISQHTLRKMLNEIGVHYLAFKDTFHNDEEIISLESKSVPRDKKEWIRRNFVNYNSKYGIVGMAKKFRVSPATMRQYLEREKII